ncbi:ABC transporter ATP-binding protein [Paraburkholderia kururiensis]|uniref:ABC transporter ATP-binding protein n=1 Tax=Paraburkholderia kururiensis TaxID=984307 RepID=UPI0018F593F6|nr:ABC transporter ATP-binding protein [Paraburkholderia kururiensis]
MPEKPSIDVRKVSVQRGGRAILHDVSLAIGQGELVALTGLNGAGKTTLLLLLATLTMPGSGHIFIDGINALTQPDKVRSRIGVVFQESALEPRLSARDNLWFISKCQGLSGRAARVRVDDVLAASGLDAFAATPVQCLSGGQRRRLELARALIARPRILLLDEATLGLDIAARHAFWSEIRTLVADGHTVLCSTHHTDEARDASRVVVLHQGRMLADDTWQAMCTSVPATIRLRVPAVEEAAGWLAGQGHTVSVDGHTVVVPGTDPHAMLPALLQRMPFRVLGAEIALPDLRNIVEHCIAMRAGHPSHATKAVPA